MVVFRMRHALSVLAKCKLWYILRSEHFEQTKHTRHHLLRHPARFVQVQRRSHGWPYTWDTLAVTPLIYSFVPTHNGLIDAASAKPRIDTCADNNPPRSNLVEFLYNLQFPQSRVFCLHHTAGTTVHWLDA